MRKIAPPSPIPFVFKVKKMDKVNDPDADMSEWIELEFLMDPDNPASGSNYSQTVCCLQVWMPRGMDQVVDGLS
jgi:hypothetical protein